MEPGTGLPNPLDINGDLEKLRPMMHHHRI
jgi:hypothetical protein